MDDLHRAGFRDNQVGFLTRGEETTGATHEHGTQHAEPKAAVAGAATGGAVGGILGALAAGLIPGIGPIIAGGILAGVIGGVAIGGGLGAIAGALVGMGVPEEEAKYYEGEVNAGRTLVTVKPDGLYNEAQEILTRNGGHLASATSTAVSDATGTRPSTSHEAQTMQLREEELRAEKERTQTGDVRLGNEVVTEHKEEGEVPPR